MLCIGKLVRFANRGDSVRLLAAVARNGSPFPLAAGARVKHEWNIRLAALGAALRRAVELSYTPTLELETLLNLVLAGLDDGPASGTGEAGGAGAAVGAGGLARDAAGRVIALAGIAEYLALADFASAEAPCADRARAGADRCARQLVSAEGRFFGDEIDAAITIWQLGARQETLGEAARALVNAAETRLHHVALADHPACQDILALRPRRPARATRRAA
ncbi:MAG: hypothetical protein AB7K52_09000 [Phycisphaerales bacterium]